MRLTLPFNLKKSVLALGANTKNTVCFAEGRAAYLSPVHADLDEPREFLKFEKCVRHWLKRRPRIIAYDLHPGYQSTKYALQISHTPYHISPIQHHHAHIAACMAENGLKNQKVIGVAFDGTGLGTDGNIWGAEFLLCDYRSFKRAAHLKKIPLLGGERAILEPQRLFFAWAYPLYRSGLKKIIGHMNQRRFRALEQLYLKQVNSPSASSMGRLFDATASIILDRPSARYEGELPMQLERVASTCLHTAKARYKFKITRNSAYVIDALPVIKAIIRDVKNKEEARVSAYKFHLAVAHCVKDICARIRKDAKIDAVVLSGGVFQNKLLLSLAQKLLTQQGFSVFTHQKVSSSDSSLSLGQAAIAAHRSR